MRRKHSLRLKDDAILRVAKRNLSPAKTEAWIETFLQRNPDLKPGTRKKDRSELRTMLRPGVREHLEELAGIADLTDPRLHRLFYALAVRVKRFGIDVVRLDFLLNDIRP